MNKSEILRFADWWCGCSFNNKSYWDKNNETFYEYSNKYIKEHSNLKLIFVNENKDCFIFNIEDIPFIKEKKVKAIGILKKDE